MAGSVKPDKNLIRKRLRDFLLSFSCFRKLQFWRVYRRGVPCWVIDDLSFPRGLSDLAKNRYQRILDVGCATGYHSAVLASTIGNEVIGIDINKSAIETACQKYGHLAEFRVLDIGKELPEGKFDLIVCSEILLYIPAQALKNRVLPGIVSLLNKGGHLAIHELITSEWSQDHFEYLKNHLTVIVDKVIQYSRTQHRLVIYEK